MSNEDSALIISDNQEPEKYSVTLDQMKEMINSFKSKIRMQGEPTEVLQQLVTLFQHVADDQEEVFVTDSNIKNFFFKDVVGGFTSVLFKTIKLKVNSMEFMNLVKQIPSLLARIFAQNIDDMELTDAMKHVFDHKSRIYQYHCISEENAILLSNSADSFDEEERKWRASLKEGDSVDCLKIDSEQKATCWAKGTVKEREGDKLKIQFEYEIAANDRQMNIYSKDLAPSESRSADESAWRETIKTGSNIDCFDSTGFWYASTVVNLEVKEHQGKQLMMAEIAFRVDHPEGDKEDEKGNKFYGWDDKFDEWVPIYSAKLAQYMTHTDGTFKDQTSEAQNGKRGGANSSANNHVSDSFDMEVLQTKGKQIFAVQRRESRSDLLIDFLNEFGWAGGFTNILNRVESKNKGRDELMLVSGFVELIAKSSPVFHRQFVDSFFGPFHNAVRASLLESNEQQLRVTKKERFDELFEHLYDRVCRRIEKKQILKFNPYLMMMKMNSELGVHFLRQPFLDKRIDGIKLISEAAAACVSIIKTPPAIQAAEVIKKSYEEKMEFVKETQAFLCKDRFVILEIFTKERTHSQLIQRSERFLRMMMALNCLSQEDRELVWAASEFNEGEVKIELFKALAGAAHEMQVDDKAFFINQVEKIEGKNLIDRHIELVTEICTVKNSVESINEQVLSFLWKISMESGPEVSHIIVNQASIAFSASIRNMNLESQLVYIQLLISNLKENKQGYLALKTLMSLLKQSCDPPKNHPELESLAEVINHLEQTQNLLHVVFGNFKNYMGRVKEAVESGKVEKSDKLESQVIQDSFMHGDQVTERLQFIRFYATSSSKVQLLSSHLETLWDLLIVDSPVEKDQNQLYQWLREICDKLSDTKELKTQPVVSMEQLISFYHSRLAADDQVDQYKLLTVDGYQCRQSFFVLINETQQKIRRVTWESGMYKNKDSENKEQTSSISQNATKKFTSYNNDTGASYSSYSFNTETKKTTESGTSTGMGPVYGPYMPMINQKSPVPDNQKDPDDLEVEPLVSPGNLDGMNMLWRIATESTGKQVIDSAAKLLISLHHGVSYDQRDKIPQYDDVFMDKCFEIIKEQLPAIEARTQEDQEEIKAALSLLSVFASTIQQLRVLPPQERKIVRALFLLRQMIRASEKDGTHGLKPHIALSKGKQLTAIQVQNNITSSLGNRLRFDISIDNHSTLWDLKKRIGEEMVKLSKDDGKTWGYYPRDGETESRLPIHPSCIRLFQMTLSKDISDVNNGSTLSELNFKNSENLGSFRKTVVVQRKARIVEDSPEGKPELTLRANEIIEEIFDRYRKVNDKNEKMVDIDGLIKFTFECSGTEATREDHRIVSFLKKYDTEQKGYVNFQNFKSFFLNATVDGQELTVRNNFEKLGYGYNLIKLVEDGSDDNSQQIRRSIEQMPRYKVAKHQDRFNTLMKLLDYEGEVQKRANEAINTQITNPYLYHKVLNLNSEEDLQEIFKTTNLHQLLYTLEIFESLLMRDDDLEATTAWVTKFIELGGLMKLQQEITNGLANPSLKNSEKKLLEQLLKLVRIFVTASRQKVILEQTQQAQEKPDQSEDKKESQIPTQAKKADQNQGDYEVSEQSLFGDDGTKNGEKTEVNQIDSKQEKKAEEQEQDHYVHLRQIFSGDELRNLVTSKVDIKVLKNQSISVVQAFLMQETFDIKDRPIIESALQLWEAIITDQQVPIENFEEFTPELLMLGLVRCAEKKVRECFRDTIGRVCQSSKDFLKQIREILVSNLPLILDDGTSTCSTWQFFSLIRLLIKNGMDFNDKVPSLLDDKETIQLIQPLVDILNKHESRETKQHFLSDSTLQGSLETLADVLKSLSKTKSNHQQTVKILDEEQVIDMLFYKCLFFQEGKSEKFITNESKKATSACVIKESRKAGFRVLKEYLQLLKPKEMADFVRDHLFPIVQDVQRPIKWRHQPSGSSRTEGYCGIVNMGCICYMISMLQQFYMVPQFRYQLFKAIDNTPENIGEFKDEKFDDNLLKQLQILFGCLELSDRQTASAKGLCFSYKDYDGTPTKVGEQKDSQEFLNIFFERLENQLKPTSQKDLLKDVFAGNQCTQLICQSCGDIRNRIELFYNLSLQVKGSTGIHDSLSGMLKGQTIEDYNCESCNKKVNITRRSLLANMPNTLIVHLQRITFSFDTYQNEKINSHFEFPRILDLKKYSVKENMEEANDEEIKKLMEIEDDEYTYRLVGVNIHEGTADAGHYYSIINTQRGEAEPDGQGEYEKWSKVQLNPWKEFNDSNVKTFAFEKDLKGEAFGGDRIANEHGSDALNDADLTAFLSSGSQSYGKSAYMLIYERKSKKNLVEYVDEQQEESKVIKFREVQKEVPSWISDLIKKDNRAFLVDSQVFDEQFCDFLKELFKVIGSGMILTSHQYDYQYNIANFPRLKTYCLELLGKVVLDIFAYFDKNSDITQIVTSAGSIMTFCDSKHALKEGKDSHVLVFLNKFLLDDAGAHFLNIMFFCTDATSRNQCGKLISQAVTRLIKLYTDCTQEQKETCQKVIDVKNCIDSCIKVLYGALLTKECQRNWTKLVNYFEMLKTIGTSCFAATQLLLDYSDIISDLIDFFLGNNSPRAAHEIEKRPVMGGTIQPAFSSLFDLISHLIRMVYTNQMNPEERLPSHIEIKLTSDNESVKSYFLSDEAQIMLSKTLFLEKVIFDTKYDEVEEFAKALAHLCYKNLPMTRKVCKKLLKAVSYSSNEQVQRHLVIFDHLARLKDEFQVQRLEFLFGFGFLMHIIPKEGQIAQYGAFIMKQTNSQEVYALSTGLDSQIHDESLLNLLWKYKGRMDSFTLSCLDTLGSLLNDDEEIALFFQRTPTPNYNMGCYTDWIISYLERQATEAQKYPGIGTEEKINRIALVRSSFERYEQNLTDLGISVPIYIVCDSLEEKVVSQNTFDGSVELTVTQICASFMESIPTGEGNMAMNFNTKQTEEQKLQESSLKGEFQSKQLLSKGKSEQQCETSICNDLLYRISARNLLETSVKIKISFHPVSEGEEIDLVWPEGGIKDFLKPGMDCPIITLRRRNPMRAVELNSTQEMSKLNIALTWKQYDDKEAFTVSNYSTSVSKIQEAFKDKGPENKNPGIANNDNLRNQRRNGISIVTQATGSQINKVDTIEEEKEEDFVETENFAESGMKACPYCTLNNPADATQCDCCGGVIG